MTRTNLICLPFAGGNAYSYNGFEKYFSGKLNMINPELPGRGVEFGRPLINDACVLADQLFNKIASKISHQPYAIYGHSMGSLLAYLIAIRIETEGLPAPVHLFCSGRKAPSLPATNQYHKLPDPELIAKLREYGGSPEEVLSNNEIMAIFLPIIRNDFEVSEAYKHQHGIKLNIPITVFIGNEDTVSYNEAAAWQDETNMKADVLTYPGGHFFIFDHAETICNIILKNLITP